MVLPAAEGQPGPVQGRVRLTGWEFAAWLFFALVLAGMAVLGIAAILGDRDND